MTAPLDSLPETPAPQVAGWVPSHAPIEADPVSEVLGLLQLRGTGVGHAQVGPQGLVHPEGDAYFHVVETGSVQMQAEGATPAVEATAGALVLVPRGRGHRIVARSTDGARLLTGMFRADSSVGASMLAALPSAMVVASDDGRVPHWLAVTTGFMLAEASAQTPGRAVMLARLVDLLFVQAVRHWLRAESARGSTGWVSALGDPKLVKVLGRLHAQLEHDWSVDALAQVAALSRSAFTERFVAAIGEPPMRYLARARMSVAARMLRGTVHPVAEVGRRVGYASEAAFSRKFKETFGISPQLWREPS